MSSRAQIRSNSFLPGRAASVLDASRTPLGFDRAAIDLFLKFNAGPQSLSLHEFLVLFERAVVFEALARMNGNQREAARFLKLKHTTLNMKVKKQHIGFAKKPLLNGDEETPRA